MAAATPDPDPYLVLGVARTATAAEIRAAYRELAARYHPDRHQGNPLEELTRAKMAEINRAYETLSDPARRDAFDNRTRTGFSGGAGSQTGGVGFTPGFGAGGRAGRRLVKIVALLSLLPLIIRFGGVIVRALAALARELFEGAALIRGTPFAAGAVLLAAGILGFALLRRRRGSRGKNRPKPESGNVPPNG